MTAWITAYISRLLIGGLMVWCLLAIAGRHVCAMPLRLAGACFMILLTLTPILRGGWQLETFLDYAASIEGQFDAEVESAQDALRADLHAGVEEQVNAQLARRGCVCHVLLEGGLDDKNQYTVTGAVVKGASGDLQEICIQLEMLTGLQAGQIRFAEEDIH
ncbi:MAG: hypothetical protein PUB63_07350 [Clostridia bacterium]|nr:hypothetical protein [Clostridia bacterium]